MEYKALERLYQIQLKNSKDQNWVNKDLYKFLYKKEMYLYIYEKNYVDSTNKTKKVSSKLEQSIFLTKVENLVLSIKNNTFKFQDPLSDLVQKLLKLVLEAIYYYVFIKSKYCNIENKSYRDILENFSNEFETSIWFFRNLRRLDQATINTDVLSSLLGRRICDSRFIQLIIKYVSETNESRNNILFSILINIYLSEFDFFVKTLQDKYKNLEDKWKRRLIRVYIHLLRKISVLESYIVQNYEPDIIQTLSKQLLILKRQKIHFIAYENANPSVRITYGRCYNDWILGINGNSVILEEIKKEVGSFLKTYLKLDFDIEKSTSLHFKSYKSLFLAYNLSFVPVIKKHKFKTYLGKTYYNKMLTNLIKLDIPFDFIRSQLAVKGFCNFQGIPIMKKSWSVQSDTEIMKAYTKTLYRITSPYIWLGKQITLKRIEYILKHSCVCTLAYKHKCSIKKIYYLYETKLNLNFKC